MTVRVESLEGQMGTDSGAGSAGPGDQGNGLVAAAGELVDSLRCYASGVELSEEISGALDMLESSVSVLAVTGVGMEHVVGRVGDVGAAISSVSSLSDVASQLELLREFATGPWFVPVASGAPWLRKDPRALDRMLGGHFSPSSNERFSQDECRGHGPAALPWARSGSSPASSPAPVALGRQESIESFRRVLCGGFLWLGERLRLLPEPVPAAGAGAWLPSRNVSLTRQRISGLGELEEIPDPTHEPDAACTSDTTMEGF